LRHLRLHQQARALQQALARLRIEPRRVAGARELAEEVELVGEAGAGAAVGACRAARAVDDAADPRGARIDAQLRRAIGIGDARDGAGLGEPRGRRLDAGVVAVGGGDEAVEHRVPEGLPPLAARLRLGGRGHGPAAVALLELSRCGGKKHGVDGGWRRAAGKDQGHRHSREGGACHSREGGNPVHCTRLHVHQSEEPAKASR
jgi:hypothetical protein